MKGKEAVTTLFCDLGGVLLTNGWDRRSRKKAAETFNFDFADFDSRHQMLFGDYEVGKITLDEYLHHALFYEPRSFSKKSFTEFIYTQSEAYPEMIEMVKRLKEQHHLKVVVISNEGKELTQERLRRFALNDFVDTFLISCFLGMRKPDKRVYRLALDITQVPPAQTAYIEDRQLFVEIAKEMGINAIRHLDREATQGALEALLKGGGR